MQAGVAVVAAAAEVLDTGEGAGVDCGLQGRSQGVAGGERALVGIGQTSIWKMSCWIVWPSESVLCAGLTMSV